jgi:hypothetical protein
MRYSPWVVSEHVPDYSSLEALVQSPRFQGKSGQELAIALWELIVDRDLGIFHYLPALERFSGKDVYDPIKILNVYGFTICHCHAHMLAMIARIAGFKTRIANIQGHEGTEIFYDGAWHYFDADIQYFHRKHPPEQHIIASREDTYRDPSLVDKQENPSFPYGFPDRLPEMLRKLYEVPPSYLPVFEERIHTMDYRLRPGEEMVRLFHHKGRWVVFDYYPKAWLQYTKESGPEGPTERFWPRRQWGNGFFRYAPNLSSASRDLEIGADSLKGFSRDEQGLVCSAKTAETVFSFDSPYIFCGVPDPLKRVPSERGAVFKARFILPENASASLVVEAAGRRRKVWSSDKTGDVTCDVDYTPFVDGLYNARLRIKLSGEGARITRLENTLWFMVSPHSLPALRNKGANRMSVHHGDKHGLATRSFLVEFMMEGEGELPPGAYSGENLVFQPDSYARLLPQDPARPWKLVYELRAPSGKIAWVDVYAIIEGAKPGENYDGTPAVIESAESPDGPWTNIAESQVYEHPEGWHFGLHGEAVFVNRPKKAYIRFSCKKGMKGFRIGAHYILKDAELASSSLLEIEHAWYEVDPVFGRRLRMHKEVVQGTKHEYSVACSEEPHDESITLRVPSVPK